MTYERLNIQRLDPYTPGEQPTFLETGGLAEHQGQPVIKLNTNENPYPPAPSVMRAIRELVPEALRLYPPADSVLFRQAAAGVLGVEPDQLIATNGGDELLRLLLTVFCEPELYKDASPAGGRAPGGIGMTRPSYTLYSVLAAIQDTPVAVVDRVPQDDGGFALPDDYAARLNAAGCKLAFLVNPHAPTGRLEPLDTLRRLASEFEGVLVIDEAYVDFAPPGLSAIPLLREGVENVVILRSLSKGYSLAGLRLGFGIASEGLIAAINKARDSYNVDILAQTAATAAIRDQAYARSTWESVRRERDRVSGALRGRGFTLPDSHSNFVLARVPDAERPAEQARRLYQGLKDRHILVRYFDTPLLADRLRITLGTPEQNTRLLQVLDTLL